MDRKFFAFFSGILLLLSFTVFGGGPSNCPTLTEVTMDGGAGPVLACPGDSVQFILKGQNLPGGGEVRWYENTHPIFNPYNGEGVFIGNSEIPGILPGCPQVCPDLLAIFINSCNGSGNEENNEFLIMSSGTGFSVDDLQVDYDPNNNANTSGGTANNDINLGVSPCGFQTPDSKLIDSLRKGACNATNIIPVSPGDDVPGGVLVFVFASNSVTTTYDLGDICTDGKTVYVLQSNCDRTAGAFTNSASCTSTRYRVQGISLANCNCSDTLVYDRCGMLNQDGEYAIDPAGDDTATVTAADVLIGNPPCNGPNFDQLPVPPVLLTFNYLLDDSLCNVGPRYIKGIVSPAPVNGCQLVVTPTFEVNVLCPDVIAIPLKDTICNGSQTAFQLSSNAPGTTFTWTVFSSNNVNGASAGNGNSISQALTLQSPGTGTVVYEITPSSPAGCSGTPVKVDVLVKQTSAVKVEITGDLTICTGERTTLTASDGFSSYDWSNNEHTQGITVISGGTYIVIADAITGCSSSDTVEVIETSASVDITGNLNICNGSETTLTATADFDSYSWSNQEDGQSITINTPGEYSVIASIDGCTAYDTVEVIEGTGSVEIFGDLDFCNGGSSLLTASDGFDTYNWSTGEQAQSITVDASGTYTVTASSNGGCSAKDSVEVIEFDALQIETATVAPTCRNTEGGSITVVEVINGTGTIEYQLNNGNFQGTNSFDGLTAGEYTVTVRDENQCTATIPVSIEEPEGISVNAGEDQTIDKGGTAQINATITGAQGVIGIDWQPSSTLNCADCTDPQATPEETTTYIVTVQDDNGCFASDTIVIHVNNVYSIFVPSSFSPNGDANNDILKILSGGGVQNILSFRIFNRWGEEVFAASNFLPNDNAFGWNGIYKGKPSMLDSYGWYAEVEFIDQTTRKFKGVVTLIK